jgi:hypothetical protein
VLLSRVDYLANNFGRQVVNHSQSNAGLATQQYFEKTRWGA